MMSLLSAIVSLLRIIRILLIETMVEKNNIVVHEKNGNMLFGGLCQAYFSFNFIWRGAFLKSSIEHFVIFFPLLSISYNFFIRCFNF